MLVLCNQDEYAFPAAAAARSAQPFSLLEQLVLAAFSCLSNCLSFACMHVQL